MNKNVFYKFLFGSLLGISAALLPGCTADSNDCEGPDSDGYLQLNLAKTETRADIGTDGSGAFSEGDRVGLYIDNGTDIRYCELRLEGGVWLPRLRRQDFGSGKLALSAHYPAASDASGIDPEHYGFSVDSDQSGTGRGASDLLVSQTVLNEGEYKAALYFRHAMHRLRIELSENAADAGIAVRSLPGGTVDLLTGAATVSGTDFQWITPAQNTDGSYEAVIYPQSAAPYRDGEGTLLKITVGGKSYDYKAPETQSDGSALERFEAGKQFTVKLTLREPVISEWANRKAWVYGITPPKDDDWIQIDPENYTTYYLPWKKEYGWYDCNKRNPSATVGGIPDGNMCWAASASNALHWWFAQNKRYIDMYGDRYQGPDYNYPLPKAQESDIFQCFIDAFRDEAGYADAGVNWFIHGDIPSSPQRDYPYNDGGYFKEVFPTGVKLGKNEKGMSKTRFNETIKDALSNRKAILVSIGTISSWSHIETIWGAEFDADGYVSYIYMADNNDRDRLSEYGGCCGRYKILYGTYPEGGTYTGYSPGHVSGDGFINISNLTLVELGEQYWKEYLGL